MISSEIGGAARLVGEEKAVKYVAKAGFDAWDLSMVIMARPDYTTGRLKQYDHPYTGRNYLSFVRQLKKIGEDNGIVCNQAHAPFPTKYTEIRLYLPRALECAAEAGAKCCVIHPMNKGTIEENVELFRCLLPIAKSFDMPIVTENMWNWNNDKTEIISAACSNPESFAALVDAVDDPYFAACLDIGHANIRGCQTSPGAMIRGLGSRLAALHIHDNDGLRDSHIPPFTGTVDFDDTVKALREIGYKGDFTMECNEYLAKGEVETLEERFDIVANAARKLKIMFQEAE